MNKILALFTLLCSSLAFGGELIDPLDTLYGGPKFTSRVMGFDEGYGKNMFKKDFLQHGVFVGAGFAKYFATEIEFFTTTTKKRKTTIVDEAFELGVEDFSGLGDDTYDTRTRVTGGAIQLRGHYPILNDKLKFFVAGGISLIRLKLHADMLFDDDLPATPAEMANNRIDKAITRVVPRFSTGVDYQFLPHLGIRSDVTWERTKNLNIFVQTLASAPITYDIRPNNSVVFGGSVYLIV